MDRRFFNRMMEPAEPREQVTIQAAEIMRPLGGLAIVSSRAVSAPDAACFPCWLFYNVQLNSPAEIEYGQMLVVKPSRVLEQQVITRHVARETAEDFARRPFRVSFSVRGYTPEGRRVRNLSRKLGIESRSRVPANELPKVIARFLTLPLEELAR